MHILNKMKTAKADLQQKMQKFMDQLLLEYPSSLQFYQDELWNLLKVKSFRSEILISDYFPPLMSYVQLADQNKIDKNVKYRARQFLTQEFCCHYFGSEFQMNKPYINLLLPCSAKFIALNKAEEIQQAINSGMGAHSSETEANCHSETFIQPDQNPGAGLTMETMFEGSEKTPYDLLVSAKSSGSLTQKQACSIEITIDYALSFAHLALVSSEKIFQAARLLISEKLQTLKGIDAGTMKGCQGYQTKQYLRQAIDVVLSNNSEEEQILESLRLTYLVQQS